MDTSKFRLAYVYPRRNGTSAPTALRHLCREAAGDHARSVKVTHAAGAMFMVACDPVVADKVQAVLQLEGFVVTNNKGRGDWGYTTGRRASEWVFFVNLPSIDGYPAAHMHPDALRQP